MRAKYEEKRWRVTARKSGCGCVLHLLLIIQINMMFVLVHWLVLRLSLTETRIFVHNDVLECSFLKCTQSTRRKKMASYCSKIRVLTLCSCWFTGCHYVFFFRFENQCGCVLACYVCVALSMFFISFLKCISISSRLFKI